MHVNLRGAVGAAIPVLLGTALAIGTAARPASASTWADTGLAASAVQNATFGGAYRR